MTRPDPLRKLADRLFCRIQTAVPIEDNLLLMIEHALRTARSDGYRQGQEEAVKAGGIVAKQVYEKGFREGQESMRERAAKIADEVHVVEQENALKDKGHLQSNALGACDAAEAIAIEIRALPTEPEGKDANVDSNVVYTGQCRHNIPYGQPCIGCQRS